MSRAYLDGNVLERAHFEAAESIGGRALTPEQLQMTLDWILRDHHDDAEDFLAWLRGERCIVLVEGGGWGDTLHWAFGGPRYDEAR